ALVIGLIRRHHVDAFVGGLLVLVLALMPDASINTGSYWSGVALFLALYRTASQLDELPPRALIVLGATGVAGMSGSYLYEREFHARPNIPSAKLQELISRNQTLGWGGIGLGVAGAGLVGASFAVGF
ncbi:MAG: hypothetical protein ABMA64_42260, partial [Myxococcota bacterium]